MARGMANGEGVVSQAQTKAFDEGYERTFKPSERSKERGRWVWDEKQQKLVRPWEYDFGNTEEARAAPISSGRFYENTSATDGTDIGSRKKHREYMKRNGLCTVDDYTKTIARKQKERREFLETGKDKRRDDLVKREVRRIVDMPQSRYDAELKKRERQRAERGTYEP